MVRKQRKRISYVLPLANSTGGHRLGVNGLAVDSQNSILYSGGRDGVICAWDLNLDLSPFSDPSPQGSSSPPSTNNARSCVFRQQAQAHTHWINDIVLAQSNQALVSASSDITVKIWRPYAQDPLPPQTIGLHADYVKTLASPGNHANWVASGGLDRKIYLWDLTGKGQQLQIDVGEDENTAKGSVYALAVTSTLLACGGPESIVRVWDPRSGKRVTKFVGHTDNIRDVLISLDGDTIMTASSDQTVKVWSMTAGRCMYTLTMHNDSVWSLYSDHPRLSVFYSSDRSGLVAKTDTRGVHEMDEGIAVAVCQEHEGVNKVIGAGDHVWTATSSSSINRWADVDTEAEVQAPETYSVHRSSIATTTQRSRIPSQSQTAPPHTNSVSSRQIPHKSLLRLSNAAPFYVRNREESIASYSGASLRKASEVINDLDTGGVVPVRTTPEHTIEGQHGLIKHVTLNDRRRVLTLDTASEVVMWDLLHCVPVKSFGKRDLDSVLDEVNTQETVAHWCAVDTRTGSLTCVLEENTCFDAEMYADELDIEEKIDFREDQRINLGKWVLRYLFSNLIDEEIKKDERYRQSLQEVKTPSIERAGAPTAIAMPTPTMSSWLDTSSAPTSASTLKATNGFHFPMNTPGLAIGLATPAPLLPNTSTAPAQTGTLSPTAEETSSNHARTPSDGRLSNDYFSAHRNDNTTAGGTATTPGATGQLATPEAGADEQTPTTPDASAIPDTPSAEKSGMFGKKMWKNFGMKSLKKTTTKDATAATVAEEKAEDSDSRSSKTEDRIISDNFFGAIQKLRLEYDIDLQILDKRRSSSKDIETEGDAAVTKLESKIQPSLPNDTPVLKPPNNTTILIQEDRVDSGGVADLFEGTVGNVGIQSDIVERVAPVWLADVLLRNSIPPKEIVKVSFILEPWQGVLPSIATDGDSNTRLNANRMLRARKILSYVAERIEPQQAVPEKSSDSSEALRPEDYLELYCQNQPQYAHTFGAAAATFYSTTKPMAKKKLDMLICRFWDR
ncbi:WD repeat protein-like protein [Tothia fuscella]|uniref:WD repeat protein-like protein n=1 Tax=Tothia fuscella TaxID=1048955 RepID=A0A9P4NMN4_9PEZI|nr:WD repeat protein-like protein [Tothia fuscella]